MGFWLAAALVVLAPTAVRPEGRGDCKIEEDTKECKANAPKSCKDDNGDMGRCSTRNGGCFCIVSREEAQVHQIARASDSVKAALNFPAVLSTVGSGPACHQLSRLITNFLDAKDRLVTLSPMTVPDARLVDKVDRVLTALPELGSYAMSCGTSLPVGPATSVFLAIKAQLADRLVQDLTD